MSKRERSKGRERKENIREERKTLLQRELLTFNFKYLDQTQPKAEPGTIESWGAEGLLNPFFVRLIELSGLTREEAVKQGQIKIYGDFPPKGKSDFSHPFFVDGNVSWSVIKKVAGQVPTVAGFIVESTFYVVFLDKKHRFWISEKKHT